MEQANMTAKRLRYPVGIQTFSEVRTNGYVYVDKTSYIYHLAHWSGKTFFLSRPRRFGKSLLISTMQAYFEGRYELFEGLAVSELEGGEWESYPVIRVDLSTVKTTDSEQLVQLLDFTLAQIEKVWGRDPDANTPGSRLYGLINVAHAKTGKQVVVLVDEYDAPLLNVTHDAEKLQAFREVMREFYAPLKACDEILRFVFLSGITKFSQLSIFSELNNLKNISMDARFGGICGITAEEIDTQLAPDVAYLADCLSTTPEDCRARLKRMYDGYRFSKAPAEIYNPFSLVTALDGGDIGSYWFGSGTPTSLVNMLAKAGLEIPELEGVRASAVSFDAPTEAMGDPIAFMYQSGYLTIKDYSPELDTYTLGIPNKEVSDGLFGALLPVYTGKTPTKTSGFLADLVEALLLMDDPERAMDLLRSFLKGVPFDLAPKNEKAFQALLYVVFKLVGARIATEVRTSTGAIDAVVDSRDAVYIIELKYRSEGAEAPTAADALAQIDERGYAVPFESGEKPVVKVGAVFSAEERTIEEGWLIVR